jgi:hypothetical protein
VKEGGRLDHINGTPVFPGDFTTTIADGPLFEKGTEFLPPLPMKDLSARAVEHRAGLSNQFCARVAGHLEESRVQSQDSALGIHHKQTVLHGLNQSLEQIVIHAVNLSRKPMR